MSTSGWGRVRRLLTVGWVAGTLLVTTWVAPAVASRASSALDGGLPPGQVVMGVAALSPDDVWAVGYEGTECGACSHTALARHWNGAFWQVYEPFPDDEKSEFTHVAADAAGDVWAVGTATPGGPDSVLTVRWDGAQWIKVPADIHLHGSNYGIPTGVSVVGPDDVWVSGQATGSDFVMHWDGVSWQRVHAPFQAQRFLAITATSSSDAWLAGGKNVNGRSTSFTEHWDGNDWSVVPNPNPQDADFGANIQIESLSGTSASDVWAVGGYYLAGGGLGAFIEHWDGRRWKLFRDGANPPGADLYSVSADSPSDAWAVGVRYVGNVVPYLLHWTGRRWIDVPGAGNPHGRALLSVSADGPADAWAVGGVRGIKALVERWDGSRWSMAPQ